MSKIPKGFLSTLIAQKKLSGNGNSNGGSNATISDSYNFNPSIKELPTFHTPDSEKHKDYGMPIAYVVAVLARKAKNVYERHLASEQGKELLLKANEYEIPCNPHDIDIITLRDKVEEFEEAIEKAASFGINWREFGYDLLGIEQEIAEVQAAETDYMHGVQDWFLTTRGVEA